MVAKATARRQRGVELAISTGPEAIQINFYALPRGLSSPGTKLLALALELHEVRNELPSDEVSSTVYRSLLQDNDSLALGRQYRFCHGHSILPLIRVVSEIDNTLKSKSIVVCAVERGFEPDVVAELIAITRT